MTEPVPVVVAEDRSGLQDPPTGLSLDELADLMAAVLSVEGVAREAEAGLHLVGVAEISDLNAEHMDTAGQTDVLSFPVDGSEADGALVGDVVLCPQVAVAQAPDHAGTALEEFRLLVVHGALHLCGWDHADDDQRDAMWQRERELMGRFDVLPSRDPWTE